MQLPCARIVTGDLLLQSLLQNVTGYEDEPRCFFDDGAPDVLCA